MKINISKMNYKDIIKKLKKGVGIANREDKARDPRRFNSNIERIMFQSALSTGLLDGYNSYGDLTSKLKSGAMFPDDLFGWSTKTVLAILLVLLVLKLKSMRAKVR